MRSMIARIQYLYFPRLIFGTYADHVGWLRLRIALLHAELKATRKAMAAMMDGKS